MTTFNKARANSLSQSAIKELQSWAKANGVNVQFAGGNFSSSEFTLKLKFTTSDPEAAAKEAQAKFNRLCGMYGLESLDYMKAFSYAGKTYQLRGFEPRRRKYGLRVWDFSRGKEVLLSDSPAVIQTIRSHPANVKIAAQITA